MISNEKELKTKLNQLISDSDFLRIQESFEKQSLFQLLGFGHRETMHSSFISWLLSPTSSLNLGTFPLKRFLYYICEENKSNKKTDIDFELIESDSLQLEEMEVATEVAESVVVPETNQELRARFDLCLTNDKVKIVVENKVLARENKDQTETYTQILKQMDDSSYTYELKVFLSPDDAVKPKCPEFIQIDYQGLYDFVIVPCLNHPKITTANKNILEEYIHNLRMVYKGVNKPMAKVNNELCVAIYDKYKDVLDEIFDAVKNETPEKRKVKTSSPTRKSNMSWKEMCSRLNENEKKLVATYGNVVTEAEIDLTSSKILFNGKEYSTPSAAAIAAVNYVQGKEHTERYNGYDLWSIAYQNGERKKLSVVREEISLSLAQEEEDED
ncbi:PD-(D/E)XK nuclease family protein [Viridibacillus sp. YIM B01967]|uniref:PD-(D/E)XK nuclease family protein n=1 Tax=Viridibacillus soli TaxID=2798301 RepID=A0ABS1HAA0_9BACL|nr:PD-(D/E)XK nuclease family protein [Viridibacillus soli]MBK3496355.1 PD-(D/E)XK nuclease family protein [Viridibacillus soli]